MADTTKIEWADKTWSPWIGCTKVSAGCAHCYAESHAKRTGQAVWGPSGTRVKTSAPYWKKPLAWNAAAAKAGTRLRVFPSLCDPFEAWGGPILDHKGASLGWCEACGWNNGYTLCVLCGREYGQRPLVLDDLRRDLSNLIDQTINIDWLLVTKRPERARRMLGDHYRPNVWIITSVEDQASADARIPELLKLRDLVPVLGISYEPALGPVDLAQSVYISPRSGGCIDWLIVGGESGPKARPCDVAWIRSAVEQCRAAGVPVFVKQLGACIHAEEAIDPIDQFPGDVKFSQGPRPDCAVVRLRDRKGGDPAEWPEDIRVREFPEARA